MSHNAIDICKLSISFGRKKVLKQLDFQAREGQVTAIIGRNGEGKSTLVRAIAGMLIIPRGVVSVLGSDPATAPIAIRKKLGYAAPDRLECPSWMTVYEYLQFLKPIYPAWDRALENELLDIVKLDGNTKFDELSKGGRTKLSIVAALAHRPSLLLLDEPFSGLDPIARRELLQALIGQLAGVAKTTLLVSHSMDDVERLADRIAVLADGAIAWEGTTVEARNCMKFATSGGEPAAPSGDQSGFDLGSFILQISDSRETMEKC